MAKENKNQDSFEIKGFLMQESPRIYHGIISGSWLLERATPSWRITDPIKGFQRLIREDRARQIAVAVLDQGRSFPNSIVLATNVQNFRTKDCSFTVDRKTRFFVVDGQHRLWAQQFSEYEAEYSCLIHTGLTESEMATLFLEINDNQKRVPSSLRWDLVRLTRPDDDIHSIIAVDITYALATEEISPLYQRIDLTGEQSEIKLKQGSVAPEIKLLVSSKKSGIANLDYETQYQIIFEFVLALKQLDAELWTNGTSVFYKARVFRAALKLIPDIIRHADIDPDQMTYEDFLRYLELIDVDLLDPEEIVAMQGESGIRAIFQQMHEQIF